jgi:hypothetical protein
MTLITKVYIKPQCRDKWGINEAYDKAAEYIRKTYCLFALGKSKKIFRLEFHIDEAEEETNINL